MEIMNGSYALNYNSNYQSISGQWHERGHNVFNNRHLLHRYRKVTDNVTRSTPMNIAFCLVL